MKSSGNDAPRALLERWPQLRSRLRFAPIGNFPTPVTSLASLAVELGHPEVDVFEKRDDLTSALYGGNKIRTLEVLFGHALEIGATEIWTTGAYGSNHAAASAMHAPRVGLVPGICVYPQPHSTAALTSLELILSRSPTTPLTDLPHWSALPFGMWRTARDLRRRGVKGYIMEPGGAIPLGALGYVSAALELAGQIEAKQLPAPANVIVPAGSNCTTAGLLLGFSIAAALSMGFSTPPRVTAVRVTPWPVTTPFRILRLATQTSELLASLTGNDTLRRRRRTLSPHLRLLTQYIGRGYGFATRQGREAVALWSRAAGHELDTTYSAKAAAAVIDLVRDGSEGPILYWSTKTSAKLPSIDAADLAWAPPRMQRWMAKARHLREPNR